MIVLEGEMLYNLKGEVPEGEHVVPIGRADVKRPGRDVTFVCHSKTVAVALKAAEQLAEREGISAEVLDLRSLRPLDEEAIVGSVARTNRAVVIEEGWPQAPPADVKALSESLVRLAISYVTTPGEAPEEAAGTVAELLGPFIDKALGSDPS